MHLSGLATQTTAQLREISGGARGTLETLKLMRALVRDGKKSLIIRNLVLSEISGLKQKDFIGEIKKIHSFVRDRIRYVKDIRGVETLQTPEKTLEFGQGDCDDKSVLVATLLEAIGHPTRLVAMGFRNGCGFCHVYVETKIGSKWVGVETTEPVKFGWTPPNTTSRMVIYN